MSEGNYNPYICLSNWPEKVNIMVTGHMAYYKTVTGEKRKGLCMIKSNFTG